MRDFAKSYSEMLTYQTFEERYQYLALRGNVGESTFGFDRWLNQQFYTSRDWRRLREHIIVRDNGCDLAMPGYEVMARPTIHHLNPLDIDDIVQGTQAALDPDNLVLVSHGTHNAIHYGDESRLPRPLLARAPGDTKLW